MSKNVAAAGPREIPDRLGEVSRWSAAIVAELKALPDCNTATMRSIRRKYSRVLASARGDFVLQVAKQLHKIERLRWVAYELIQNHPAAFQELDVALLEEFGCGLDSWWTVDAFARILSGPSWLRKQVPDTVILKWARSRDRWRRRAALVSTVALNVRSSGGKGDVPRTLRICRCLASDQDETVAKALSWALRTLVSHDARAVEAFLQDHADKVPARVKREVNNKLRTGLKTPRK